MDKRQRTKIQVTLTPELLEKLDAYCKAIGVTRSAYIQTVIGQTLYATGALTDKVTDSLAEAAVKMAGAEG